MNGSLTNLKCIFFIPTQKMRANANNNIILLSRESGTATRRTELDITVLIILFVHNHARVIPIHNNINMNTQVKLVEDKS